MKLEELKDVDKETLKLIKEVVADETAYLQAKIKELTPVQKSKEQLDFEVQKQAFEEQKKAFEQEQYNNKMLSTLKEKGVNEKLANYFVKAGVEDINAYADEIVNAFNELELNDIFKGSEHKQTKDSISKEQFASMGYSERVSLKETNPALYNKLSNEQ